MCDHSDRDSVLHTGEPNANLALHFAGSAHVLESGRVALSGSAAELQADESVQRSYMGV